MLETIKETINKHIIENESGVTLEAIELLEKDKIAATISTSKLMGSIEILNDMTTDLMIVEFDSEEVLYSNTLNTINTTEELVGIINSFLCKIGDFENSCKGWSH